MKYEQRELQDYKFVRCDIAGLKYFLASIAFFGFLHVFQFISAEKSFFLMMAVVMSCLLLATRLFITSADKKLFAMLDKAINSDPDNIRDLNQK